MMNLLETYNKYKDIITEAWSNISTEDTEDDVEQEITDGLTYFHFIIDLFKSNINRFKINDDILEEFSSIFFKNHSCLIFNISENEEIIATSNFFNEKNNLLEKLKENKISIPKFKNGKLINSLSFCFEGFKYINNNIFYKRDKNTLIIEENLNSEENIIINSQEKLNSIMTLENQEKLFQMLKIAFKIIN